jgi:acetate kinase
LAEGIVERIGEEGSALRHRSDQRELQHAASVPDHDAGMELIVHTLTDPQVGVIGEASEVSAVGHRVVHGGERFVESALITADVIDAIEEHARFAPLHNPANLVGIRAAQRFFPRVPHVAVFDTAFHQTMPPRAYLYAVPYELYQEHGIRRYGFHGTSHRYLALEAARVLGRPIEELRLVTCHLGNGCSISAVAGGRCVDTSMGFTPLEGLVMGTRSGDLDPALVAVLAERLGLGADEVVRRLNRESGLLGLSGVSKDMREVAGAAAEGNQRAELALEVFCYRVRKYIGAYLAALGGAEAVVFSAGIGENSPEVRRRVCEGLGELGIELDESANEAVERGEASDISVTRSAVRLLVLPTDEERLIAEDTYRVACGVKGTHSVSRA